MRCVRREVHPRPTLSQERSGPYRAKVRPWCDGWSDTGASKAWKQPNPCASLQADAPVREALPTLLPACGLRRDGALFRKRYHPPLTPHQRLVADLRTPQAVKDALDAEHATLDPVRLIRDIRAGPAGPDRSRGQGVHHEKRHTTAGSVPRWGATTGTGGMEGRSSVECGRREVADALVVSTVVGRPRVSRYDPRRGDLATGQGGARAVGSLSLDALGALARSLPTTALREVLLMYSNDPSH